MNGKYKILCVGTMSDYQNRLIERVKAELGEQVEIVHKLMDDEKVIVIAGTITVGTTPPVIIDEAQFIPKIDNYKPAHRRSKGEKKRQRSEWNNNIKGYRK